MFRVRLVIDTIKDTYYFPLPKHVDKSDMENMLRKDIQTNLSFLEVIDDKQQNIFINKNNIVAVYVIDEVNDDELH